MTEKKQTDRRIRTLLTRLQKAYPDARCALNFSNPLELLIATILSAQCTDERVNQVTATLFKKYRTAADYANAPLTELERDIHSTGFYRNKAKSIKAATQRIVEEFGGQVPRTMDELLTLPGVARKTANVVLGTAFGIPTGVVVDTHVARLAQRLGLTRQNDRDKIEQDLMQILPQDEWIDFAHRLIEHGRRVCKARKPLCAECVLADICPSREQFLG
ncbi:MAG: endonuclease III [Acidobacteriota bacterium]|nr:endonuclease III [Blastocatellia bacterium]MDW8241157.1 endonuclease III [Acidobacteriota bacterium]